jgi:hypothetical protein
MLQPPWLSAHFVVWPIFVSPSLPPEPARSARPFGPVRPTRASSPTFGSPWHRRPSGVRRRAVRRRLSPSSAREEPNQSAVMPPSLPPLKRCRPVYSSLLTPSKPTRSKTPPPPVASPPPHRLPGPIKRTPSSASPHRRSLLPSFALLRVPSCSTPCTTTAVSSSLPTASPRHCHGHQSPW